tara:strand:+ start:89 stop:202 length:114 start_codon:yes stop_codon:yes gene_type:complete
MTLHQRITVIETKLKLFEKAIYALILINAADLGVALI